MILKTFSKALITGAVVLAALSSAQAQSGVYVPKIPADDSLYQAFGGQPGLVKLMDDFMVRLLADKRMNPFFKDADQKHVKAQLVVQFCEVSGGPCKNTGPDMKKVHDGMDITKTDFNVLVEVLQQSMDAQGINFSAQNRLLAQLAPMHRQIINTP
jgi:hemoglobin